MNKFEIPQWLSRILRTTTLLGALWLVTSSCEANPTINTDPTTTPTPSKLEVKPEISSTPEGFPTTLPEQTQLVTEELRKQVISDRTEFWNSPEGEKLFKLAYYEDLSKDPTLRQAQLDPIINDPNVYIFGGGFDGHKKRYTDFLSPDERFAIMNCDIPTFSALSMDTGTLLIYAIARETSLVRGYNFQGDGDTMLRLALASDPEFIILPNTDTSWSDLLTQNIAIMLGHKPDFIVAADIEGAKYLLEQTHDEPDPKKNRPLTPEEELTMIRARGGETSSLDRELYLLNLLLRRARYETTQNDLSVTSALALLETGFGISPNLEYGESGSPFVPVIKSLLKLGLTPEEETAFINNLISPENVTVLTISYSDILPVINKRNNTTSYNDQAILNSMAYILSNDYNPSYNPQDDDPYPHLSIVDYPIIFAHYTKNGGITYLSAPIANADGTPATSWALADDTLVDPIRSVPLEIDWKLVENNGLISLDRPPHTILSLPIFETAISEPVKLELLKMYYQFYRQIFNMHLNNN